jgi:hypothetical protein
LAGISPPEWPVQGVASTLRLTASSSKIEHADGTDDVQLIVTVMDSAGRQISNTPDVTLRVVSGPGVFPTGKSILFRKGTDIPILDGQAAIEFRSYWSGSTVIEATSPGLPPARLTITSRDAPAYVAGKTPEAVPGSYLRFVSTRSAPDEIFDITLDRPTNASSMAPDHQSRLASDGDARTYWSAAPDAAGLQWWESDLEGVYVLSAVTLRFAHEGSYGYEIQTSTDDRMTWHTAVRGEVQSTGTPVTVRLPGNTRTSGIRIVFDRTPENTPASLSEVQARGIRAR